MSGQEECGSAAIRSAERDEGVGAERFEVVGVERSRPAAAAEREAIRSTRVRCPDHARRKRGVGERPHVMAVEGDLVRRRGAGRQILEPDEHVVVLVDRPGRCFVTARCRDDHDLARSVGLGPDRGLVVVDVAEQGADEERREGLATAIVRC